MQGDVDVPYIVPQEIRDMSRQLQNPENLEKLQHPITITWHYVLGDLFWVTLLCLPRHQQMLTKFDH